MIKTSTEIISNLLSCTCYNFIGFVCLDIMTAVSLHFLGVYGTTNQIAYFGSANLIMMFIGHPLAIGVNQYMNTMVCKKINDHKTKSQYFYYTIFTTSSFFIIIAMLTYAYDQFKDLGEIATVIPFSWFSIQVAVQFECIKTFVMSHEIFTPFIFIYGITAALHIIWCYLLVNLIENTLIAVCFAICISEATNFLLFFIYYIKSNINEKMQLHKFIRIDFNAYYEYIQNSYSMVLHIYANNTIFFLLNLFALSLGAATLAAQLVLSNTSSIYFRIPLSLSFAFLTYISTELGQNNIQNARAYIKYGMISYCVFLGLIIPILWTIRQGWASFYSDDPVIQDLLLEALPYFLLGSIALDGIMTCLSGVLKGVNEAEFTSKFTLFIYMVVGFPLIYFLTFILNLDLIGIWVGFGISNMLLMIGFMIKLRVYLAKDHDVELIALG